MKIEIEPYCPNCQSAKVAKNGIKPNEKQNYLCKNEKCGFQFIGNHSLICKGCHSGIHHRINLILVRGMDVRDISAVENIRCAIKSLSLKL